MDNCLIVKTVTFRKRRWIAALGGAAIGAAVTALVAGVVCITTEVITLGTDPCDSGIGGAVLIGTAVGAGLGYGISLLGDPKTRKIEGSQKSYNKLKHRLRRYSEWEKVQEGH